MKKIKIPFPTIYQNWKNLFFFHFSVDTSYLQDFVPKAIKLDSAHGKTHVAVVGFEMSKVYFKYLPFIHYPSFFELNLRTYATLPDGTRIIYFFSLEVNSRLSGFIARNFYKLPYSYLAQDYKVLESTGYFSAVMDHGASDFIKFKVGEKTLSDETTNFLLERYQFVTAKNSKLYYGEISHVPYQVFPATVGVMETKIFERNNLDSKNFQLLDQENYFCRGFKVKVEQFGRLEI